MFVFTLLVGVLLVVDLFGVAPPCHAAAGFIFEPLEAASAVSYSVCAVKTLCAGMCEYVVCYV